LHRGFASGRLAGRLHHPGVAADQGMEEADAHGYHIPSRPVASTMKRSGPGIILARIRVLPVGQQWALADRLTRCDSTPRGSASPPHLGSRASGPLDRPLVWHRARGDARALHCTLLWMTTLMQPSPESPPVLFWSPSCTMNRSRYACPASSGWPFSVRSLTSQRASAV
jgi:hypothetical protein